jgi:ubiquinone/menaquinone biosynthesis C-methylase UbiE
MSRIYQLRRDVVLSMVDSLDLPKDARILEVGCGAGLTSVELARRGYTIDAIDTVAEMLELARHHAAEANVRDQIRTSAGDVYNLQFGNETFDLVIAMGVIPWLHSPEPAIKEMKRVTKHKGNLILTADNKWRLNHVLDPRLTPLLSPSKRAVKSALRAMGKAQSAHGGAQVYMYSVMEVNRMVLQENLKHLKGITLGFGPFSFLGKTVFPDRVGLRLNRFLQQLANARIPGIRSTGSHYVLLIQK